MEEEPKTWTSIPYPRAPPQLVEHLTGHQGIRPGGLQFRPSLLSEGYFGPLTHPKPILIFPKLPLYQYKPIVTN